MAARILLVLVLGISCVTSQLTSEQLDIFRSESITISNDPDEPDKYWIFEHDGIPSHEYGDFNDTNNPNTVSAQDHRYKIPKEPEVADRPGCLSLGKIAAAYNGIPIFNPYTGQGYNAVEGQYMETFDNCSGHPQREGEYHYHQLPNCLYKGTPDQLIGVALDGYAIYGPRTIAGKEFTTDDLDVCHGRKNDVTGKYEYRVTLDFPYVMGCYTGISTAMPPMMGDRPPRPDGMTPPPGQSPPPRREGMNGPPQGDDSFRQNNCVYVSFCENPGAGNCPEEAYEYGASDGMDTTVNAASTQGLGLLRSLETALLIALVYVL